MPNTEHTPAPWEIDHHLHASDGAIWAPDGMKVCNVTDRGGTTPANARLIAAAPDLLAALELLESAGLLASLETMDDAADEEGEPPIAAPAIAKARAAIAKARGTVEG